MLTRIDHLVISVADLPRAIETYRTLGFHTFDGGANEGCGTRSAIIFHEDQYLELLAIEDAAVHDAAAARDVTADPGLAEHIRAGGGIRTVAIASDDLAADVTAMRARGVAVSEPARHARVTPARQRLEWLTAVPLGNHAPPLAFVQHLDDLDVRRRQVAQRATHPNGVYEMDRIYVVGPDVEAMVAQYRRALGGAEPARDRGILIKADMAAFAFAQSHLMAVQPNGPGPAADALAARGPGVFQVIHRVKNISETGNYLTGHGITPAVGGRRSTGEMALVVGAADALGCNMGFVGPE